MEEIKFDWPWIGFKPVSSIHRDFAGVYILTSTLTSEFYVGSTTNIYGRLYKHLGELRRGEHYSDRLQAAFDRDPCFHVTFYITGKAGYDSNLRDVALDHEQMLLDQFRDDPLMVNKGIDARAALKGVTFSEEHRDRIAESLTGVSHTPERVAKMKAALQSEEVRDKISRSNTGKRRTAEHKQNMREIALQRPMTEKRIQGYKLSGLRRIGTKQSEETIQKRIKSMASPEVREKMDARDDVRRKRVVIEGQHYKGVRVASRILNIPRHQIEKRLRSLEYLDWNYE